jgi:hypothetical protein
VCRGFFASLMLQILVDVSRVTLDAICIQPMFLSMVEPFRRHQSGSS